MTYEDGSSRCPSEGTCHSSPSCKYCPRLTLVLAKLAPIRPALNEASVPVEAVDAALAMFSAWSDARASRPG